MATNSIQITKGSVKIHIRDSLLEELFEFFEIDSDSFELVDTEEVEEFIKELIIKAIKKKKSILNKLIELLETDTISNKVLNAYVTITVKRNSILIKFTEVLYKALTALLDEKFDKNKDNLLDYIGRAVSSRIDKKSRDNSVLGPFDDDSAGDN